MTRTTTIGIAVCLAALTACSEKQAKPESPAAQQAAAPPAPVLSGNLAEEARMATATVQKVDMKSRKVSLKAEDGTPFTVVAGPEVRNLAQVKKGDVLRVTYRESLAYEVNKPGVKQPGVGASTDVQRAAPGEKPAAGVTNTVTVRATITKIDKKNQRVTLKDPEGEESVVKVRYPENLEKVAVGDVVDITYTEALAIAVEKK